MAKCAYCNQEGADTRDHVMPRKSFPEGAPPVDPVIVPACQVCNNTKSRDDEWARKWFVTMVGERSGEAMSVLYGPVARSIQYRPAVGAEVLNKMELVAVRHEGTGLLLGQEVRMQLDPGRIARWVNQVVKGLFASDHGEPVPLDWDLETFSLFDERLTPNLGLLKIVKENIPFPGAWNLKNASVFAFGRSHVPENKASVWVTVFYGHLVFITFVGPRAWIEKQRKKRSVSKFSRKIEGFIKKWLSNPFVRGLGGILGAIIVGILSNVLWTHYSDNLKKQDFIKAQVSEVESNLNLLKEMKRRSSGDAKYAPLYASQLATTIYDLQLPNYRASITSNTASATKAFFDVVINVRDQSSTIWQLALSSNQEQAAESLRQLVMKYDAAISLGEQTRQALESELK